MSFWRGIFSHSVDFDVNPNLAFTLHSAGDRDFYVLKLASDGAFQWTRSTGGYRDDQIFDVAVDDRGHIYATGEFRDRVDFDPQDDSYLLETSGHTNAEAFLSKLDRAGAGGHRSIE